jgi:hypothetical protein
MNVYSDFTIPALGRHITIISYEYDLCIIYIFHAFEAVKNLVRVPAERTCTRQFPW